MSLGVNFLIQHLAGSGYCDFRNLLAQNLASLICLLLNLGLTGFDNFFGFVFSTLFGAVNNFSGLALSVTNDFGSFVFATLDYFYCTFFCQLKVVFASLTSCQSIGYFFLPRL